MSPLIEQAAVSAPSLDVRLHVERQRGLLRRRRYEGWLEYRLTRNGSWGFWIEYRRRDGLGCLHPLCKARTEDELIDRLLREVHGLSREMRCDDAMVHVER